MSVVNRCFIIALLVAVSACGGGGGGDSPAAPVASKVFAADEVNGGVGSTENANPAPGSAIAITRIIAGSNTQIPQTGGCFGCLPSLALDSGRDQLYVSTNNNILVFNNAGTATGNIAPSRVIGGGAGFGTGRHLALNAGADILYVSTPAGTIYRFNSASSASSTTNPSSSLALTPFNPINPGVDIIQDIALDTTNDVLYIGISRNFAGSVGIIQAVSTKSGSVTLDAEVPVGTATPKITIDGPRNRLYVSRAAGLTVDVAVYDNARALTNTSTPSRTIPMPFPIQAAVFIETTNDRLYASAQNRFVIINSAGSATTSVGSAMGQLSTQNSGLTAIVARP